MLLNAAVLSALLGLAASPVASADGTAGVADETLWPLPADFGVAAPREEAPLVAEDTSQQTPPAARPVTPPAEASPEEARKRGRGWNDRRRTVRSYFGNLGYDALRVPSQPNAWTLSAGFVLASGSALLDQRTVSFFDRHHLRTFGNLGATAGGAGAVATLAVGLFSAGRISPADTFRSASYDASQSIVIAAGYTLALKYATQRERPDGSNRLSFPSGHASIAFSWATVFAEHYGLKVAIPAYAVASLIAISRLPHRSHYLSDIVAGAALGHVAGLTVVRGNSRPAVGVPAGPVVPEPPKPKVELVPLYAPGGGSGLALAVSF